MTDRSANVVVIGGGVNGTSIAMHLARMGAGKVLLIEKGHLAGGATGRSGAMVREHYLHPTLVKMAIEASDIFHNFGDAVGGDARFIETGRLLLFAERDAAAARANVAMNRALGVDIQCPHAVRGVGDRSAGDALTVSLSEYLSRPRGTRTRWQQPTHSPSRRGNGERRFLPSARLRASRSPAGASPASRRRTG